MIPHVLKGAFERVARAEEHLLDLNGRLDAWRHEQENAIIPQFDPNPPDYHFTADTSGAIGPPFIVGILIGEISYNLRSALDYLIYELARHDSSVIQSGTQFPIEDSGKHFNGHSKVVRLKGINPTHIAMIERLQPYNGCDWTKILRELSNPDKHREITRIRGDYFVHGFTSFDHPNFADIRNPVRRAYHPIHGEVDVKIGLVTTVTLDDGTPVTSALEEIKTQVANTLILFKPEF